MTGDQDDKVSNVTGDDKDMGPTEQAWQEAKRKNEMDRV